MNKEISDLIGVILEINKQELEKELGRTLISNKNSLNYEYIDEKILKNEKICANNG